VRTGERTPFMERLAEFAPLEREFAVVMMKFLQMIR
jgi:hypothetical protein